LRQAEAVTEQAKAAAQASQEAACAAARLLASRRALGRLARLRAAWRGE
jgi:hypothetical protein